MSKVKAGKEELYLKDANALESFLTRIALRDATLHTGGEQPRALSGEPLADLAHKFQVTEHIIERLSHFMDADALRAIAGGVTLDVDNLSASAEALARRLQADQINGNAVRVTHETDPRTGAPLLRINHHNSLDRKSVV